MKKIISYSLWGDKPMYNVGAIHNAHLANEIYPGWISRFYLGRSVPNETVKEIKAIDNTQILTVEAENDWTGMFWRFFAIDDSDIVIFRDTDSRLTNRERVAVDEWANSDKVIHIMRDHPHHTERIMGGMWGVDCKPFMLLLQKRLECDKIDFTTLMSNWMREAKVTLNEKGIDQTFLRLIYALTFDAAFIHDQFPNFHAHSNRHPTHVITDRPQPEFSTGFPVKYKNSNDFVGQVYDENNIPSKEFADLLIEKIKDVDPDYLN